MNNIIEWKDFKIDLNDTKVTEKYIIMVDSMGYLVVINKSNFSILKIDKQEKEYVICDSNYNSLVRFNDMNNFINQLVM